MSGGSWLPVEPWCVREPELDLERLGQRESLFALANGHIGLRGNLDEGEPCAMPGTYLSSFFEYHPLVYPEGGYGYPQRGQTLINVTNGKLIRVLVDDEPFDVRRGRLLAHERVLDLRAGTLRREVEWVSPSGTRVHVRATRLVSFVQRAIAAIVYEVQVPDTGTRIIVQSDLIANEAPPEIESDDPRVVAELDEPLVAVDHMARPSGAVLLHRTRRSDLLVAAGMDHLIDGDGRFDTEHEVMADLARTTVVGVLRPGQTLRIIKYLSYDWSATDSDATLRDRLAAALTGARHEGWEGLTRVQRERLDDFWDAADVEVEGDPALQQAVRFGLFQLLQAGARAECRPIGAKGLTGDGYNGHTFWDIEGFVLHALSLVAPHAAADALRWRASTLDHARQRAGTLNLDGATFAWRTISGEETSAYWPASTAAFHVNADIAHAFETYRRATGDEELERDCGVDVLVETARLWRSLGHHDRSGRWHIDGVTGPDEYTGVVDDNVFTNLMAARNLRAAADACVRHHRRAQDLGVSAEEIAAWRECADAAYIPFDDELGVHPQCENFTRYAEWDFDASSHQLEQQAPYVELYRKQVVKQADLVLAMHWCPDAFTAEQKARNLDYYERRTVRDSSLSACTQAVVCAEVGHARLAYDYLHEAALVDLRDLQGDTHEGVHIASIAGTWIAVVEGFGGLRVTDDVPRLDPTLPDGITRLSFRLLWRGVRLVVEVTADHVSCAIPEQTAARMPLRIYGEEVEVTAERPVTRPLRRREPLLPPPSQPPGRAPGSVADGTGT